MKTNPASRIVLLSLLMGLVTLAVALQAPAELSPALSELSRAAVSSDPIIARNAIRSLREHGPEGLQALLTTHADAIKARAWNTDQVRPVTMAGLSLNLDPLAGTGLAGGEYATTPAITVFAKADPEESWTRLRVALDGVSQQRDCFASQLYWFTNFEQAKAVAKAQNKPILSLRLLGKLDEEFSCANSRFFRTTLYANAEVAQYLREHFVLHWKSVRPVPRVTIDFGDGRKLERTLTGNSIHYVLAPDGEVIDALPGLYGAKAFLRGLQRAEEITQQSSAKSSDERRTMLAAYHRSRVAALNAELEQDLQTISFNPTALASVSITPAVMTMNPPTATTAARLAGGKGRVERPILDRTTPQPSDSQRNGSAAIDDVTWQKIAALHTEDATLDRGAKALIQAKGPNALEASRASLSKSFVEDPLLRKMRAMERSISEDTVRNEHQFHRQIHEWLAANQPPVDTLNAKVYAELFLTPDSDPWLGLLPADAYAALENDGLSMTLNR